MLLLHPRYYHILNHMEYRWVIMKAFILLSLITGCVTPRTPTPIQPTMTTPTVTSIYREIYLNQVNQAKQKWLRQGITDYRIALKFYENFMNDYKSQREVIVRGGRVISFLCPRDRCPILMLKDVFTVDDLFDVAQGSSVHAYEATGKPELCIRRVRYDATYGFPTLLAFHCPYWYDDEHSVEVLSFEVLKDTSAK